MEINPEKFKKAKEEAEKYYKNIGEVHCPYFSEKVHFNAMGLEHLKFKGTRKARTQEDQYIRLRLISLAPKILKDSHTLQGISETKHFERQKINNRWDKVLKEVTHYEFVAVIKRVRVRVIVKQVSSGQKFFWSIIPFWKMNKITNKRVLHDGRPEID